MSKTSGRPWHECPNVWLTVAESTSLVSGITGAPQRCAGSVILSNANVAAQTAVLTGANGIDVTITLPIGAVVQVDGEWSALGAFGDTVTAIVGWFDDGSVRVTGVA